MRNDYNPNTKPVWMALVPMVLGLIVVALIVMGVVQAVGAFNDMAGQLDQLGQAICLG